MIPQVSREAISTESFDADKVYPLELSTITDVKIRIIDLDDNEPEFGELFITRNISDNLRVGSTIDLEPESTIAFIPLAHDRDTFKENTNISYFIMSGNEENKFELDVKTGELKLVDELERSLTDLYRLGIIFNKK